MSAATPHLYNGFAQALDVESSAWSQLVTTLSNDSQRWRSEGFGGWEQHWSRVWEFPWMHEAILAYTRQVGPGAKVLESGSGTTLVPVWLASQGMNVTGIDLSGTPAPRWAAMNKVISETGSGSLTFQKGDMLRLDFADNSFDVAFSLSALEHTTSPFDAVLEMLRVVRPGGLIAITCDVAVTGTHGLSQAELNRIQDVLAERADSFLPHRHTGSGAVLALQATRQKKQGALRYSLRRLQRRIRQSPSNDFAIFAYAGIVK